MKTKLTRVPELAHRKLKLIATGTQVSVQQAYLDAVDAYISKLKADNPVYEFLLHATDFMVEDNGAEATQDMFTEDGSVAGFSEQPKL